MEPGVVAYENNFVLFHVMQKLLSNPEKDGAFLLPILSHVFCFKSKGSGILNPQRYSSTWFLSRIF
jgi:hypothetical protein